MAKYIEREAVLNILASKNAPWDGYQKVSELPASDVQPVKWISVGEQLPDFEGMCLCMRKSYSKANFRYQEIMYFDYDNQAFCSNADGVFVADGNVTHWMPLPKPPKDGET